MQWRFANCPYCRIEQLKAQIEAVKGCKKWVIDEPVGGRIVVMALADVLAALQESKDE